MSLIGFLYFFRQSANTEGKYRNKKLFQFLINTVSEMIEPF